jgi:2-oxoglutarate ferredoxin oxidoreductase subunit alpha
MMEKVTLPVAGSLPKTETPWATVGKSNSRERNIITSLIIQPERMEKLNLVLQEKYRQLQKEVRWEEFQTEDAELILVAFGLSSRICDKTMNLARANGLKVGLLRPITLYPFPSEALSRLADKTKLFLTVEMNAGQMVEDVRLSVNGKRPVYFYGRMGGMIPSPEEVLTRVESIAQEFQLSRV